MPRRDRPNQLRQGTGLTLGPAIVKDTEGRIALANEWLVNGGGAVFQEESARPTYT